MSGLLYKLARLQNLTFLYFKRKTMVLTAETTLPLNNSHFFVGQTMDAWINLASYLLKCFNSNWSVFPVHRDEKESLTRSLENEVKLSLFASVYNGPTCCVGCGMHPPVVISSLLDTREQLACEDNEYMVKYHSWFLLVGFLPSRQVFSSLLFQKLLSSTLEDELVKLRK